MLQNIRDAIRTLASSPGFTAAAVLSLAIGIGANTAIFSVVSALLLHPLPFTDAERLVILWNRSPGLGITEDWFSTAQYFDIRNGHSGFEQVAIAIGGNDNLTGDGEPERVGTIRVSANLLSMLGARPALGRLFLDSDDVTGAAGTAVLGFGTWMRRYGGDPRAVGRSVLVNGQPYQIVGVLPSSFSLPREVMPTLNGAEDAEILLPLQLGADAPQIRGHEDYNILGKLKPGVSAAHAQAEMDTITARLRRDHPDVYPPNGGLTFGIVPLQEQVVGDVRRAVLILSGSVVFVLLIACANVANLMLSRALACQKEIAIRTALGASRGRIVTQLLTESVLLALIGGALGLVFAFWSARWIQALGSTSVPRLREIAVNGEVLLFTATIATLSGVLFGLAPALRLSRPDLLENLKTAGRGSSAAGAVWSRGQHMRRLLVVSELALSVMLLIGAGLLIRSFARLQEVSPGFNPDNVLTLELRMSGRKYTDGKSAADMYRQIWRRLDQLPGVSGSGAVSALPLSQMFAWGPISVEGRVPPAGEKFLNADERTVVGRYFQTMKIPLVSGRFFEETDTTATPRVAIVDQYMANQIWPSENPVGRRIKLGPMDSDRPWVTVVGVVGRVKQYTLDSDSRIALYLSHAQYPFREMTLVLRSSVDPTGLTAAVRREIRALDPDLPMYRVRTMSQRVDESLARRRFSMLLLTLFAALALGLATIGIYGVIAYLVSQGAREIGIRLALGATPRGILMLVVRHGMAISIAGVAVGLVGAFALTRFMHSLLFEVRAVDALTFTVIPALLASVAIVASYVPARRAARIDPAVSLRSE